LDVGYPPADHYPSGDILALERGTIGFSCDVMTKHEKIDAVALLKADHPRESFA
jgi:hypothetical protein